MTSTQTLRSMIREALLQDVGYEEEFIADAQVVLSEMVKILIDNNSHIFDAVKNEEFRLSARMLANMICGEFQSYPLARKLISSVICHDESVIHGSTILIMIEDYICWLVYAKINNIDTEHVDCSEAIKRIKQLDILNSQGYEIYEQIDCCKKIIAAFKKSNLNFIRADDALRGLIRISLSEDDIHVDYNVLSMIIIDSYYAIS